MKFKLEFRVSCSCAGGSGGVLMVVGGADYIYIRMARDRGGKKVETIEGRV